MPLPCIVHWHQRHFVVVYGIRKKKGGYEIQVSDPASGLLRYDEKTFLKAWLQGSDAGADEDSPLKTHGIALILEPTPKFYQEKGDEDTRLKFGYLLGYLRPYRAYIAQILLAMLVASVISLILPFITQSVVDVLHRHAPGGAADPGHGTDVQQPHPQLAHAPHDYTCQHQSYL